jgi:hypothetical protein
MNGKPWTAYQLDVLRAEYANTSTEKIAQKIGRKTSLVTRKANLLGLTKSPDFVRERGERKELPYGAQMTFAEIAKDMHCTEKTAQNLFMSAVEKVRAMLARRGLSDQYVKAYFL